jgi:hypothetical protein
LTGGTTAGGGGDEDVQVDFNSGRLAFNKNEFDSESLNFLLLNVSGSWKLTDFRFGFGDVGGGLEAAVESRVGTFVSSSKNSDVYELNMDLSWGLELPEVVDTLASSFKKSDVYEPNIELS